MQPRLRHTALNHRGPDPASGVELPVLKFTPTDSIFENLRAIILRVIRRGRPRLSHAPSQSPSICRRYC